jgi:DNA primase
MKNQAEIAKERLSFYDVISLLEVKKKSGNVLWCCCPFHSENTASFKIDTATEKFHCFGCQKHGDKLDLYMQMHGISDIGDALREILGDDYQAKEEHSAENPAYEIIAAAAKLYQECLLSAPQADAARQYLAQRGVPHEFVVKYQLGYAPDAWDFLASRLAAKFGEEAVEQAGLIVRRNSGKGFYDRFRSRVMFPILDHSGRVCAFGGRVLGDGQPKYMNSPESPVFEKGRILFGLHQHRETLRSTRRAVIVEGNFDLLLLNVHGIGNTAAPLGTALTKEHVRALRGLCDEAVLLFDGDAAGMRAARRSVPIFLTEGLAAKAALLPAGHDPDSFVREHGADALRQLIDRAEPLPEFIYDALAQEHGLTLAGKSKIMKELAELVRLVPDRAQRELMAGHFADYLGVNPAAIFDGGDADGDSAALPVNAEEIKLVDFLKQNPHLASSIISTFDWSSRQAREYAESALCIQQAASVIEVNIDEVEQAIDNRNSLTIDLPDDIAFPGGLISLGMQGLSADGLPKYTQLNLPVVLSVIGQALCGKISIGSKIPALYNIKIAPSQIGKSEGSDAMIYALRKAGLMEMIGPSKLQSGQSIIRALSKQKNIVCFCDEGARMFAGDKNGRDGNAKTMIETLLTLFTQNGGYYSNVYSDSAKNVELDWFAFGLCANAVPDAIDDVSVSSLSNGLITRLNFFCYDGEIMPRGIAEDAKNNSNLDRFAAKIADIWTMRQSNDGDKIKGGAFSLSIKNVKSMLQDISDETIRKCNENLHDSIKTSIIGQIYDMTLRLAMIHIGSSREAWEITAPVEEADVVYGYRLARLLTDWKLNVLIRRVSGSEFEEFCNVFYDGVVSCHARYLAGKGGRASIATISERKKKAKWPLKIWTEIINYMEETNRITVDRKGQKMFFAPNIK